MKVKEFKEQERFLNPFFLFARYDSGTVHAGC